MNQKDKNMQKKEIEKISEEISRDTVDLIEKYVSISTWDVPENDEDKMREKIIEIIKDTLNKYSHYLSNN